MNNDLETSNNAIIEKFMPELEQKIHEKKVSTGVKHFRKRNPKRSRVKPKYQGGEINKMVIGTNRGEILGAQKGVGGRGQASRHAKEIFTEPIDDMLPELADEIASNTGDVIGAGIANLR